MQFPTIPGALIAFGSVVLAYLANWLKSDGLPQRTNIIIGWIAVIIIAIAGLLLTGNFTSDLPQDFLLAAIYIASLAQQITSLLNQAQKLNSPLVPKLAQPQAQFRSRAAGPPTNDAPANRG
jgi:branched-subunit amino acid ABC-type transport system permease component